MIYAAVYKPSQWKASLQIITGIRRIGENLNKEYSVCQTGKPGAILFPALGLSIYGLISIPFLKGETDILPAVYRGIFHEAVPVLLIKMFNALLPISSSSFSRYPTFSQSRSHFLIIVRQLSPAGVNFSSRSMRYSSVSGNSVRESTEIKYGLSWLNSFALFTAFQYPLPFPASPVV